MHNNVNSFCVIFCDKIFVAPIKLSAASDDARSDDLCDPTNTIGIGNPASANERKDDV
jgi:hypothetical protein